MKDGCKISQGINISIERMGERKKLSVYNTYVFVQETANAMQVRIKAVPYYHLQPADLHLSIHAIQQSRVAA